MEDPYERPRYDYNELVDPQEIRLLLLSPGLEDDEMQCSLKHVLLSSKPEYEALSYAWGSSAKPRGVVCDDMEIPITESLFVALRYLRHPKEDGLSQSREKGDRCIWVDAICINQSDDNEKGSQVSLMGRIFSEARSTVVWLGEDKNNKAENAFDGINEIDEYLRMYAEGYQNPGLYQPNLRMEDQFKAKLLGENVQTFNNKMKPIFDQSWFQRLWVVQEFVRAKEAILVFGIRTIPLAKLVKVINAMQDLAGLFTSPKATANQKALVNLTGIGFIRRIYMREYKGPSDRSYNILELQQAIGLLKCKDPRDRIYSVLSLTWTEGLSADYTMNTEQVFQHFANWALDAFPDLKVLSYARGLLQTEWKLPSWTPCPIMKHLGRSFLNVRHFQACGMMFTNNEESLKFYSQEPGHKGVLGIEGVVVDSVLNVAKLPLARGAYDEKEWEDNEWDFRRSLLECRQIARPPDKPLGKDVGRNSRFCSAMIFELTETYGRASAEHGKWFHHFLYTAMREIENPKRDWYQEYLSTNNTIAAIISMWAFRRRFCLTARDRFAWIPEAAECNDKIFIICGARIPFALRPQPDGKYALIGECWIEGLMEGEALNLPDFNWERIYLI